MTDLEVVTVYTAEKPSMSFLNTYLKKYRLQKMDPKLKKHLGKLESQLEAVVKKNLGKPLSFVEMMKEHGHAIGDLIERLSNHFKGWEFSWKTVFPSLKFVISISTEIYQIVDQMHDQIVSPDMTPKQQVQAKISFGKDLVWFVWTAVGPFDKTLTWIPFKKTIEKMVVRWLGGIGINAAMDFFNANKKEISSFSANNTQTIMKAI